jgi:hypothetical protein
MRYSSINGGEGLHYPTKIMTNDFNPQIGDRCHWQLWTDVEPCTVIKRTAKTVTVRLDKADVATPPVMVPGGFAAVCLEPASYSISENPDGRLMTFSLRASGAWKGKGTRVNEVGNVLRAGWKKFHDYGF